MRQSVCSSLYFVCLSLVPVCMPVSVYLWMFVVPTGAPQNFTAIGVSPTSVRLQWDPPAQKHRHGSIIFYEVVYHQRAQPLDDFASNSSDLSTLIEGLQPNTDYSFQLRAYTSKGPGPWNNRLPFRTFGSCECISNSNEFNNF